MKNEKEKGNILEICSRFRVGARLRVDEFLSNDFVNHPPAEVRHVLLLESDGGPARYILCKLASEHAAIAAVHLLRNVLHAIQLPLARVQRRFELVQALGFQVGLERL